MVRWQCLSGRETNDADIRLIAIEYWLREDALRLGPFEVLCANYLHRQHRSHFLRVPVNCAARTPQDDLIGLPASGHDVIRLMEVRDQLPDHPLPDEIRRRPAPATIRIEGLVAHPVTLDGGPLGALKQVSLDEPFACEEGWTVPGLRWRGVVLADVLALAQPLEPAQFVSVCSGGYSVSVALSEASRILVCDTLDDMPLSLEHGGPWRLVVPMGQCFTSVKWVERLEVTAQLQHSTGEVIARERPSRTS
jgi:DMSO/TMAO reductase YedYZ molybdopterin-dependent catalytic subunit